MASSDDDEELKMALALSMQQSSPKTHQVGAAKDAIDLTSDSDEEDEDMKRALALSLRENERPQVSMQEANGASLQPSASNKHVKSEEPAPTKTHPLSSEHSGTAARIFGLDRKAMEAERLARLGKRKRDPSPERPSKQIATTTSLQPTQPASTNQSTAKSTALQYPEGVIKRTFAIKYPRTNDITIDEVLQALTVDIAVISAFMWDAEWLWKKLSPVKTKQIWIMNVKDQATQERYMREMQETGVPNLKIHYPPMGGMIHSMHSKFMLLFGKDKLRVVVQSANMTPIDWGEVENDWQPGVMENSVFLIDLPRRADGAVGDKDDLTAFGKELVYFLEAQQLDSKVIDGVLKFDFSQTHHLAFVHSMYASLHALPFIN